MIAPLTSNAQAILLLTAPLIIGKSESSHDPLSLGEYNQLARILRETQRQPSDLLGPDDQEVLKQCAQPFGIARLESLLGRGFQLSQAVERWNARSIWVISRADATYPKRLKALLKENAPPVLYGCGDLKLLEKGGLAVVGSRQVDEELIRYTENVGKLCADAHYAIISGGAKGIDRASMNGALQAGGEVAGVMADSLERAALAHDNREPFMDGRLVLVSPYDPAAGFNVGNAMQRNKLIYALADAALVVTADFEKGGTWAGAIEQLKRFHLVPIYVRDGASVGKGNSALLKQGARPWPNPQDGKELELALNSAAECVATEPKQEMFSFMLGEKPSAFKISSASTPVETATVEPNGPLIDTKPALVDERLKEAKEILIRDLVTPRTETEVAALLALKKGQAKALLIQLVEEGVLEKISKPKPIRYRKIDRSDRLL